MLRSVSDNNLASIETTIQKQQFSHIFLVDYAEYTGLFLEYIAALQKNPCHIVCFTENIPDLVTLAEPGSYKISKKPWSLAEYYKFLTASPHVDFKNHKPVYDEDVSRLHAWRRSYMQGPLKRLAVKIRHLLPYKIFSDVCDHVCMFKGLALQILILPLRPWKGEIRFRYQGHDVQIFFDGGPEKDHYGENPLIDQKLSLFAEQVIQAVSGKSAYFIATGPRHEYISRLLDLEEQGKIRDFSIFAAALFRAKSYKITERRENSRFSAGTNISAMGKPVYSDHCLSVGAGEKELWTYNAINNHE